MAGVTAAFRKHEGVTPEDTSQCADGEEMQKHLGF